MNDNVVESYVCRDMGSDGELLRRSSKNGLYSFLDGEKCVEILNKALSESHCTEFRMVRDEAGA